MDNDPLGIGVGQTNAPSTTTTNDTPDPLGIGMKKADTSLSDSYKQSSQNNPDHVSQAQEISQRRKIDPNYALANIDDVKKADAAPDFDALKSSSPATHKLVSDPKVMGKAWDDIGNLQDVEGHAQAGKQASTLLQAALAGFQGSGTGLALRGGMPNVVLGPKPPFAYEAASAAAGMASDLPEMIAGGFAGGLVGGPAAPFTAAAAGFAAPAAFRQALIEHYTHGNVESTGELLRRAIAIAVPTAKQAAVGVAMAATGGGAAALGAGGLLTKGAEVVGMTTASAALEGKYPTARDLALNGIMLTGAHVAGITWDRMGEAAQASKLRTRDPQTFADHADSVSSPAYIPAEKFDAHFGPDAESMAKKLGIEQAYNAAKASGGDIEIPAGKYLSKDMDAHRDAFKEDVKSDPEAMTANQVKESDEKRKEEAKAPAEAEPAETPKPTALPAPDPVAVNVRVIHHAETPIDSSGEPTPEEKAMGVLPEPQTHGPKFKGLGLTDKGKEQAAKVGEDLRDQNITKMFSGTSQRVKETARGVGHEPTPDERFGPLDLKGNLDGMPISEYKPILKDALDAWAKNPDSKQLGDESFNEFQARNLAALRDATANAKPGENIGITLSSDSVQLFKLIAENGGMPLSGDLIKRMSEKEAIKPAEVSAYRIDPATGLLSAIPGKESPESQSGGSSRPGESSGQQRGGPSGNLLRSQNISINPNIDDVKARADDWLAREAMSRGVEGNDKFKLQYATHAHDEINAAMRDFNQEMKSLPPEKRAEFLDGYDEHPRIVAARGVQEKMKSLLEAYPEIMKQVPHDDPEASAKILEGFNGPEQTPMQQREFATAQAVADAQRETGQGASAIEGLDPKTQAELDRMQEAARKEAEKILMKPQLEELKAKNRALISSERERAENEFRAQINNEPVMRAWSMFKVGKEAIWTRASKYITGELDDENTLKFEAIAEFSGFSSADEMAKKLITTDPAIDVDPQVKTRLEQHMAQFADLKDTDAMHDEALKAVHTEKSGELLALQQQVFQGMSQNAEINAEQAKARRSDAAETWQLAKMLAKDTINTKPVETAGRFRTYYTGERDAAVRVEKAKADGDFQEAAKAMNEQLTNHALASESLRVRDDIERWHNSIEKQQKADKATWKDQDHFFQAAEIMKRFGFEREDYNPSMKQESLSAWADRMSEKAGEDAVNVPDWLKDESVSKDWRKLTPSQLEDVRNTLKNIKHLANTEDVMTVLAKGIERQALVSDLIAEANKNVRGGHTPGADPRADFGEKMWNLTERWGNVTYAVETMLSKLDGWKLGGKWGNIVTEKSRAQDNEAARMADDAAWWNETNKVYTPKELVDLDGKKIYIPEIRDSLSKRAMMVAIANTGTESNARVLKEGRGWTDEQIEAIKGKMEKRDFDVMQALLDRHENNNKPALAEMAKRRAGFEPKWIDAKPIETPFGTYAGGYIPLVRDNRVSSRGMEESSLDEAPQTFKAATYQGFNKERNSHAQYPVSLDMNDQLRALNRVSHYLTMQDWVSDMNSLMNDNEIKSTIIDTSGKDRLNTINNWVKDVAGNSVKERGALDGAVRAITDRSVISQLGTKLSVTLATGTHGIFAVGGVDPENFGPIKVYGGLMSFLGGMVKDPLNHFSDAKQFMLDNSKYMAQHAKESETSIQEAADRMAGKNSFSNGVREFAFSAMHGLYNLTITPIWNDAYKTGLTIKDGDHDAAVDYANMIVRGSSPPGRTSDIPTIMHDSSMGKLLFLMHGFADRQYQMMVRAGGRYGVQVREAGSPADVAKATSQFLGTYANVLVIPGMAMAGLKMVGSRDDEREHKILQKHIVRSLSPLTTYPVISSLQDMALDAAMGVKGNTNLSSVGGAFDAYQHFANETASRRSANEQKAEAAAKVASFAAPYPQTFNDAAFNMADIIFNGMSPRASDLIRRRPRRERGE